VRAYFRYTLLAAVLAACSVDEPLPLVKSYTKDWESDLGPRYSVNFPVLGKTSVFRFLHINQDGSMFILHTPEISPQEWTLTKVSSIGEFITDVTLPGEYIAETSMDEQGNLETLSANEVTRIIRKWSSDLAVIQNIEIPYSVPPRFSWMKLHRSSYYLGDYEYDAQNTPEWSVTKYGLDGTLKWTRLLSEYGTEGLASPLVFGERDELLFVRFTYDSIRYSKVNGTTGDLIWGRQYPMTDFGSPQYYPLTTPLNNGQVLVVGGPNPGVQEDNWSMINQRGAIYHQRHPDFPEEDLLRLNSIHEEEDGGFLVTVGTDWQTSLASFKLLKLDSKFNVGWVGTFNQLEPGYVAQLKLSKDQVVILTSNGYLYGLKRKF
jgi:hypothetical protein